MTKLTKSQIRDLEFWLKYKNKNPTIIGIILFNAKRYALSLALLAGLIYCGYEMLGWWLAGWLIALCVGSFARDIGHFRRRVRFWPITREITDWDKVDLLLGKHGAESSENIQR